MPAVARVGVELDTKNAVSQLNKLNAAAGKTQKGVGDAAGAGKGAGAGFRALGAGANVASIGVKGLGAAVATALGPITAAVAAVASLGKAFEVLQAQDFAEAKFESLGGNAEALKANLKDVSRELSGQASVVELTGAAYDVASAGFVNAADASEILKAASQGATGGFSDINTVGDATTSVLNAYGKSASEAGKLVDGFIQTQNDGKIVIGEYAANIAKVAPVAAALGVPLEEVNAAVAQITAGGQGAEVTFTALKTAFAQVAAGKVGKEFEKFGVEISAATLKSDGLAGTLEKIKESGADAGTIIKAFGTEAGPSILALLNDTDKYNKLLENQKNAQGAAADAAFKAADTIQGALKRLSTAFENLFADQSELGEALKNIFKVAAVTVEAFGAAIELLLIPSRFFKNIFEEIGKAVLEAFGVKGTSAARKLEEAFQFVLKTLSDISNFFKGLGILIGREIGSRVAQVINGAKAAAQGIANAFSGVFQRVAGFITKAYNLIPKPIRDLIASKFSAIAGGIQSAAAGVGSFISDTVALGAGATDDSPRSTGKTGGGIGGAAAPDGAAAEAAKKEKDKLADLQAQVVLKERLLAIDRQIAQAVLDGNEAQKFALEQERVREIAAAEIEKIKREGLTADQQAAQIRLVDIGLASSLLDIETQIAQKKQDAANKVNDIISNLQQEQGLLQAKLAGTEEEYLLTQLIAQLTEGMNATDAERVELLVRQNAELEKQVAEADKLEGIYQQVGQTLANGVVSAIEAAVNKTRTLAEVAMDLLNDLARMFLRLGINAAFGAIGSGLGIPFSGGFANGGRPPVGKVAMVGENGPELFIPSSMGRIIPNGKYEIGTGGGNTITVNVDAKSTEVQGDDDKSRQLGTTISRVIQAELVRQQRPGGLLHSMNR